MKLHHDEKWLRAVIDDAVTSFNGSPDRGLLLVESGDDSYLVSVGERAIAHRFAVHIERVLLDRGYPSSTVPITIDCEYNRHRGAVKCLHVKKELKDRVEEAERKLRIDPICVGWYFFTVFPDIVVHQRRVDENNLIVVEMKRASNSLDDDYDRLKLELFTGRGHDYGYGYRLGASVIAMDKGDAASRKLEVRSIYSDGTRLL